MSHTPGRWESKISDDGFVSIHVGKFVIASVDGIDNGRLISASPDLLEVVKDIVSDCEGLIQPGLYSLAKYAIAKATGGAL